MTSIVLWVMMSMSYNGDITYSPPVRTQAECEEMQKWVTNAQRNIGRTSSTCIQIRQVLLK